MYLRPIKVKMLYFTYHLNSEKNSFCGNVFGLIVTTAVTDKEDYLTSDEFTIGKGLKYQKPSEFVKNETLTVTYQEPGPSGQMTTMTTINLKRKTDETEADDGTHISCRFLNEEGGCSMHPDRPGVCYLYPFSSWLENEKGKPRVHATYQFTGDCPGFYLAEDLEPMKEEFKEYSKIIYDYNMASNRTNRRFCSVV